ncbi:MAG TPA: DUF2071 domain-containing protein [Verrucomicrobiae bacterium]|nr:DUF2071 domain-containing protein [Verrucomicrobiae bacterium]
MIPTVIATRPEGPSNSARRRMLGVKGEPLFYSDWLRAVFIHYEVVAGVLQREVPFELDLHQGKAYISLVAFTMRDMRPRIGGSISALLFKPIATHGFLNVRTYVKHQGEPGIYFLAEWLSNPLSLMLGPPAFGLPYRFGRLDYRHEHEKGRLHGLVTERDQSARLEYISQIDAGGAFHPCSAGSREEFLMERYTAFTANQSARRFFRIWHPPWVQSPIHIEVPDIGLLTNAWPWFKTARLVGANYSPGIRDVWMGRPQRILT